jgi:steroid 5-alpha reductase family enzyme
MNGFPWAAFCGGLAASLGAALAVMLLTFAVAVAKGMHRVVDVAWGLAFAAVAVTSYGLSSGHGDDGRRLLVTALTVVWGLRLAGHIAWRGRGHGEDPRYDKMLAKAGSGSRDAYAFRTVYLLQGALVWVVSLPVQAACYAPGALGPAAAAGTALWALGLVFEAVGDWQLARFKADPANKGRLMDRGLWSWTRHPNYFGDFCVWWGLFLLACDAGRWQPVAVGVAGPLIMSFLLTRGSGKALLERHMADRPGYREYVARTSGFLPRPPRRV